MSEEVKLIFDDKLRQVRKDLELFAIEKTIRELLAHDMGRLALQSMMPYFKVYCVLKIKKLKWMYLSKFGRFYLIHKIDFIFMNK